MPATSPGAPSSTSATCPEPIRARTVRELHLLPAARRTVPRLSGARPQQRDAARPARLQHRLVPADHARAARRSLHRRDRQMPRHLDPAAAAAARRHRLEQGAGARAGGAAGGGDIRARPAAVLPGDLRFHLAADRVRPRGAARRRGLPGAAASRRRHHQMRDGRRMPRRRASPRTASTPGSRSTSASRARSAPASCSRAGSDGSYITDQLKPREQRRNKDLSWARRRPDARPRRPQRARQRIEAESKRA